MCVILHSLRKKHLKRLEVIAAMKHNNSGFYMSHWSPTSTSHTERQTIRTLSENEALGFFDKTPDEDVFVMHARIPSKGSVNINNVHGWEEDGIAFCHNMTMSSLNGIMSAENWNGTDSEYFFRKLFMPMHRGEHLADPSLSPNELGPATKRLTMLLCGETNKFLFVMPDNSVIRAGSWSTAASEKRIMTEEREVDEVIGESVDLSGNITKKTQKVKRAIAIEREYATVLASNLYYRSHMTSSRNTYASAGCTTYGNTYGNTYGVVNGYNSQKSAGYSSSSNGNASCNGKITSTVPDWESYYDDDYDFDDVARKSTANTTAVEPSRAKYKKGEASEDDMRRFLEWRKSLPGYTDIEFPGEKELKVYGMFSNTKIEDGKFDHESLVRVFNMLLRVLVYNSFSSNIDRILELDDDFEFSSTSDEFEAYAAERINILDACLGELDSSLALRLVQRLKDLTEDLQPQYNPNSSQPFILPSEILTSFMLDVIDEIDGSFGVLADADLSEYDSYGNKMPNDILYDAHFTAIDKVLNLSFDAEVKSNKDIEKYVRAATIVGRRLRWIPAPIILGGDSMTTSDGNWLHNKGVEQYLNALNFIAEACVSYGESVARADRRFVSDIRNLGFDFSKLGSMEIFTGVSTASPVAAQTTQDESQKNTTSDAIKESADSRGHDHDHDHEPAILGDPEKKDGGAA